ncbi:hypothetical protein FS837_006260 [Tulasnella sp. UAMH 9824]|nr:hypothetical protein FS837_006260 [Tulasnella sp. UAMH 9824]
MSGLALPQLPQDEYPSYPVGALAAPSLEQEAENIWQKNKEILQGFKTDILRSEPRSKEFRFAIRVAKHFFGTASAYDASGRSEALQFIDAIRKRHEVVMDTSAERQLLRSVRKVLSAIFEHYSKFSDQQELQRRGVRQPLKRQTLAEVIIAFTALSNRYTALGEEKPTPPFALPCDMNQPGTIDPSSTNLTDPQRPVIRPPPPLSESPGRPSDQSSPTPLRSTDQATFINLFDQSSTSNGLALPFQVEHQLTMNEVNVDQPPPIPPRPPNRVAAMLMRAMALKNVAQTEAPVVEPSDPVVASSDSVVAPSEPVVASSEPVFAPFDPVLAPADPIVLLTHMEGIPDPEDVEMEAGEQQLGDEMLFQWTNAHEPASSPPQEKEHVVEDTPMENLEPEVIQNEVSNVEVPKLGGDDSVESSLTNVSTPSLGHADQPATEPELPQIIESSTLSEELRGELQDAVRPLVTFFQGKSDNSAVKSQAADESLVARYGPDLLRVAKEALDEIRTKYVLEEVKRSLNASPAQDYDDLFTEPDDVEPPVQEPSRSPPPPPQLYAEPESAVDDQGIAELPKATEEPEPPNPPAVVEQELADPPSVMEPEFSNPPSVVEQLELPNPPSVVEQPELPNSPSAVEEPELTIQMDVEPAPRTTYSEQGTQTSHVTIQFAPEKEQIRLYEVQETGIASFTVHDHCCRTSFSFEIAPEFYEELRNDRTAKIIATCSQEPGQSVDDPIDDSWILMRVNWTGNPDSEFLLIPNKSKNAPTKVQQVIPLGVVERVNRLDLRRSWCVGGLRGLRVDIKVARAVRQQRKRGREAFDGEGQDEADSETLGHFVDTFKRARI